MIVGARPVIGVLFSDLEAGTLTMTMATGTGTSQKLPREVAPRDAQGNRQKLPPLKGTREQPKHDRKKRTGP
jgi:hypothetical protein